MSRISFALVAVLALPAAPAFAQKAEPADLFLSRYELGLRMKAFETRWEKTDDAAARKRAAVKLADVHGQFLSFRFSEAIRTLDLAAFAFENAEPLSSAKLWAASLAAVPEKRLIDGSVKELSVTVRQLYAVKGEMPKNLEVQFWFNDKQVTSAKPTQFPFVVKLPVPALGEFTGLDRRLYFLVESGRTVQHHSIGLSQVSKLDERLAALKQTAAAWKEVDTIEKATIRDRVEQLTALAAGGIEETDIPAASLLANAEAMLDGKPVFTAAKSGQFWMSIPLGGKKAAPVRVYIPKGLDAKKPVPVVVGLHGAGGSENLFFEGYGAGQAVKECEKRGWIFVATRSGLDFSGAPPVAAVLDELAKRYPLDASKTFVVGHSMGAGQTVALAQKHPGRFAGIACLGGGGIVRDAKAFATLPVFLAAGEKDFGLDYTKELNKTLLAGGAKAVKFKEYPGLEHLLIVREALPDVFDSFDTVATPRPQR